MKHQSIHQTGRREAPDSSVRPAKPTRRQWAEAYRAARQISAEQMHQQSTARQIATALSIFGGRVIAVETKNA